MEIEITVLRCCREIGVKMPILNAVFDADQHPTRVQLGMARVKNDVWMGDVCIYAIHEGIDLMPFEEMHAVRTALRRVENAK